MSRHLILSLNEFSLLVLEVFVSVSCANLVSHILCALERWIVTDQTLDSVSQPLNSFKSSFRSIDFTILSTNKQDKTFFKCIIVTVAATN